MDMESKVLDQASNCPTGFVNKQHQLTVSSQTNDTTAYHLFKCSRLFNLSIELILCRLYHIASSEFMSPTTGSPAKVGTSVVPARVVLMSLSTSSSE
jgi:hypothetical protein